MSTPLSSSFSEVNSLQVLAKRAVRIISILGASLIIAQGAITPAVKISQTVTIFNNILPVGHKLASDPRTLQIVILTVTFVLVVVVFQLNRFGASTFGYFIGPICFVWLILLTSVGLYHVIRIPRVLWALSPYSPIYVSIVQQQIGVI